LPYRPGHNIDVIKEDASFDEAAAEKEGRDQLPFESRLSTGTNSSSEENLIVSSPFADAVELPKRPVKVTCPKAAANAGDGDSRDRGLSRSVSAADSESSTASTESTVHSELTRYIAQHYNPENDVVLRMEFIKESQMKGVLIGVWAIEIVGLALLALGVGLKLSKSQDWFFRTRFQEISNVVIGVPCWLGLTVGAVLYIRRLVQAKQTGKRWSHRRIKVVTRTVAEHVITYINVTAFCVSNIYVLDSRCRWFSGLVSILGALQWSCWNATFCLFLIQAHDTNPWVRCTKLKGFRPDSIIMDAPRLYHMTKFIGFLIMEGLIIAVGTIAHKQNLAGAGAVNATLCRELGYDCTFQTSLVVLTAFIMAGFIMYFLGVLLYLHRGYEALRQKPYTSMRMANLNIRFHARLKGLAMSFFMLCLICFIYIGWGTCVSFLQSWLGFQPMMLVMTGVTAASTYVTMPNNPKEDIAILQIWLQEFSWGENELAARKEDRLSSLQCEMLRSEPMFCFETSLKMLYWSMLVYRFEEATDNKGVTLEGGMKLYGLEHFELMHERVLDTKALMAWNHNTVVLSFRGTASFKNVLADLRAWYAAHPPLRGRPFMGTRPYVHQGFLRSWEANGLREKVVSRVNEIVSSLAETTCSMTKVRVYVTGHSLGGALATLAAYDIQGACDYKDKLDLSCYTFGAPRTGNHAFAYDYNDKVPDTWNVINDQDTVPRAGKFVIMYKRPGQRVLINSDGDMIVRPSFIEAAVQKRSTSSVAHHLLVNYQRAHIAIIKAQFTSKRMRDGMSGVLQIAEACGMKNLLKAAGVEYKHLRKLERFGDSGIPRTLLDWSSRSSNGVIKSSSSKKKGSHASSFSVDFDLAALAAAVDEKDRKDGREVICSDDSASGAPAMLALDAAPASPTESDAERALERGEDVQVDTGEQEDDEDEERPPHIALHMDQGLRPQPIDSLEMGSTADLAGMGGGGEGGLASRGSTGSLQGAASMSSADEPLPITDAPLQNFVGSIVTRPGEGKHARYTHFNGHKCMMGGRAVEKKRGNCEGGFCRLKDRPKEADVVEGAESGQFCLMSDRPTGRITKAQEAAAEAARRLLGK